MFWGSDTFTQTCIQAKKKKSTENKNKNKYTFLKKQSFFLFKIIYLFYVYEHTVAVFRHTRRGHLDPITNGYELHMVAGN